MIFAGPAERIELVHKAEDRMIFARGALHAALWARGQKPGLYSMADVLGLEEILIEPDAMDRALLAYTSPRSGDGGERSEPTRWRR